MAENQMNLLIPIGDRVPLPSVYSRERKLQIEFMELNQDCLDLDPTRLVSLSRCFVNMILYNSFYSLEVMEEVHQRCKGLRLLRSKNVCSHAQKLESQGQKAQTSQAVFSEAKSEDCSAEDYSQMIHQLAICFIELNLKHNEAGLRKAAKIIGEKCAERYVPDVLPMRRCFVYVGHMRLVSGDSFKNNHMAKADAFKKSIAFILKGYRYDVERKQEEDGNESFGVLSQPCFRNSTVEDIILLEHQDDLCANRVLEKSALFNQVQLKLKHKFNDSLSICECWVKIRGADIARASINSVCESELQACKIALNKLKEICWCISVKPAGYGDTVVVVTKDSMTCVDIAKPDQVPKDFACEGVGETLRAGYKDEKISTFLRDVRIRQHSSTKDLIFSFTDFNQKERKEIKSKADKLNLRYRKVMVNSNPCLAISRYWKPIDLLNYLKNLGGEDERYQLMEPRAKASGTTFASHES